MQILRCMESEFHKKKINSYTTKYAFYEVQMFWRIMIP